MEQKKEVTADHIHFQNDILKISEPMIKATVEVEQEIFGDGKFENIDAVIKTYDHTKTVDCCDDEDEVKKDKLKEKKLLEKKKEEKKKSKMN